MTHRVADFLSSAATPPTGKYRTTGVNGSAFARLGRAHRRWSEVQARGQKRISLHVLGPTRPGEEINVLLGSYLKGVVGVA